MDVIGELVLGFVDCKISERLSDYREFKILRYRDDYRIFTNSDDIAEKILKVISDSLEVVGMKLNPSKTRVDMDVVEGSLKAGKLAGIFLQDCDASSAMSMQNKLLRLHSFGSQHPNSGALQKLVAGLHVEMVEKSIEPSDHLVQIAIATDIAIGSPEVFPVVAGIVSHLISAAGETEKIELCRLVRSKMRRVPHNGYLEVWLQRATASRSDRVEFKSSEGICRIVNGENVSLWNNNWISSKALIEAMAVNQIITTPPEKSSDVIMPEEVELFRQYAMEQ